MFKSHRMYNVAHSDCDNWQYTYKIVPREVFNIPFIWVIYVTNICYWQIAMKHDMVNRLGLVNPEMIINLQL